MAKTTNNKQPVATADTDVKKRKKQAKREAKLMLQLELARKDVTKAQQKLAKAENTLLTRNTLLGELEQQLTKLRGTKEKVAVFELQPELAISELDPGDIYEEDEAVAELHKAEQEPAEGREDIGGSSENKAAVDEALAESIAEDLQQEDLSISSGAGSIDILTQDEHAWPPSEIREELVEGIAEEVKADEAKAQQTTYKAESSGGAGNKSASDGNDAERQAEAEERDEARRRAANEIAPQTVTKQQDKTTGETKTSKQSTEDTDKGEHGSGSEENVHPASSNGKAATTRRRGSRRRSTTQKTDTTTD
jgi:hypothetical protein